MRAWLTPWLIGAGLLGSCDTGPVYVGERTLREAGPSDDNDREVDPAEEELDASAIALDARVILGDARSDTGADARARPDANADADWESSWEGTFYWCDGTDVWCPEDRPYCSAFLLGPGNPPPVGWLCLACRTFTNEGCRGGERCVFDPRTSMAWCLDVDAGMGPPDRPRDP